MKKLSFVFVFLFTVISLYSQASKKTPQDYYDEGVKYTDNNEYEKAIKLYNDALKIHPNNTLLYSGIAFSYLKKNDFDLAIDYCNKAINADKNNEKPYRYLGNIYFEKKDYNRAIEYFTRSINILPDRSGTYNNRAVSYLALGRNDDAISDFQKAVELNSKDDKSCSALAALFFTKQDYGKAISFAKRALEINPNNNSAKEVLNTAEKNRITVNDNGDVNINITVQIGKTMSEYLKEYPYLQANSIDSLIDKRSIDSGRIFIYTFDKISKKLIFAHYEDYSSNKLNIFNAHLTEWIKDNDELEETNDRNGKIIINIKPKYKTETADVYQSLALTDSKVMLSYSIIYK
jgi:tetratricopeptide (TPR) repeat protein